MNKRDGSKYLEKKWLKWFRVCLLFILFMMLIGASWVKIAAIWHEKHTIHQPSYMAKFGRWDEITLPEGLRINAVHQSLLPNGKILLIAGSGNNQKMFDAGTFKTLLYDPKTGKARLIDTPEDMFCSGHAFLPNGHLLIAGGTTQYQVEKGKRTRVGGIVTLFNETPNQDITLKKGTILTSDDGIRKYATDSEVYIPAAAKDSATSKVTSSQRNVWVDSVNRDDTQVAENQVLHIDGLIGEDAKNFHGYAPLLDIDTKKDYQGARYSYEFNPWQERYEKTQPMVYARWYPSLTTLSDGHIMAISGLDGAGRVLDGQTEVYESTSKTWVERPDLKRFFPTYPAIFQTDTVDRLFFAGSTTGWGKVEDARKIGFWNLEGNVFTEVNGMRDKDMLETSAAAWYGFVNDQKIVVIGGGGTGDKPTSTSRIDVIDLKSSEQSFSAVADLEDPTRYPNTVVLPDGNIFITNGSREYRGIHSSDILKSYMLYPDTGRLERMANPRIGRNYHSTAVMMPNGQILVAGSDPLFADKADTKPGIFQQRIEVYSPPYMFNVDGSPTRPPVFAKSSEPGDNPTSVSRGGTYTYNIKTSRRIEHITLVHPGSATHVTDVNARIIDLPVKVSGGKYTVSIPENPALTPPGYYMLYAVDEMGHISSGFWVRLYSANEAQDATESTSSVGHTHMP